MDLLRQRHKTITTKVKNGDVIRVSHSIFHCDISFIKLIVNIITRKRYFGEGAWWWRKPTHIHPEKLNFIILFRRCNYCFLQYCDNTWKNAITCLSVITITFNDRYILVNYQVFQIDILFTKILPCNKHHSTKNIQKYPLHTKDVCIQALILIFFWFLLDYISYFKQKIKLRFSFLLK